MKTDVEKVLEIAQWKAYWAASTWVCGTTGVERTLPEMIREGDFYPIGDSFVDVGRIGGYSRTVGNPVRLRGKYDEYYNALKNIKGE